MKRGFNPYDQHEQESSSSEPAPPTPNPQPNLNPAMYQQFGTFPPQNGMPMFAPNAPQNPMNDNLVMSLFQIVEQQSRALQSLMAKVETITQRSTELNQKIKELRENPDSRRRPRHVAQNDHEQRMHHKESLKTGGDILEADSLIQILFGGDKKYEYKLEMAHKLELPLYRERNFFLDIALTDAEGETVKNTNKIPLSLALYSSENPPKFIEKNTAGQKILKGYIEQSLHQGYCRFEKIQIKEVTSHFRNGWVFIVIIPSMTPLGSANPASEGFIDYTKIQPLVLEKVVVKAKKLKEVRKEEPEASKEHLKEAKGEDKEAGNGHLGGMEGEERDEVKGEEAYYSQEK